LARIQNGVSSTRRYVPRLGATARPFVSRRRDLYGGCDRPADGVRRCIFVLHCQVRLRSRSGLLSARPAPRDQKLGSFLFFFFRRMNCWLFLKYRRRSLRASGFRVRRERSSGAGYGIVARSPPLELLLRAPSFSISPRNLPAEVSTLRACADLSLSMGDQVRTPLYAIVFFVPVKNVFFSQAGSSAAVARRNQWPVCFQSCQ